MNEQSLADLQYRLVANEMILDRIIQLLDLDAPRVKEGLVRTTTLMADAFERERPRMVAEQEGELLQEQFARSIDIAVERLRAFARAAVSEEPVVTPFSVVEGGKAGD